MMKILLLMRWSWILFSYPLAIYMVDYIYGLNVDLSIPASLGWIIMVNNLSDVFLDSVYNYFVGTFKIYIPEDTGL